MFVTRQTIALSGTTGDCTTVTSEPIDGRVFSVHLQYGSAAGTGFATTAVVSVTTQQTAQSVWSETLSTLATTTVNIHRVPRQIAHTAAGVALTATESLVREPIYVGNDRLVITATNVGSGARAATLTILSG